MRDLQRTSRFRRAGIAHTSADWRNIFCPTEILAPLLVNAAAKTIPCQFRVMSVLGLPRMAVDEALIVQMPEAGQSICEEVST
jgi:hypothetical protein